MSRYTARRFCLHGAKMDLATLAESGTVEFLLGCALAFPILIAFALAVTEMKDAAHGGWDE